jgi:hypothetical protein
MKSKGLELISILFIVGLIGMFVINGCGESNMSTPVSQLTPTATPVPTVTPLSNRITGICVDKNALPVNNGWVILKKGYVPYGQIGVSVTLSAHANPVRLDSTAQGKFTFRNVPVYSVPQNGPIDPNNPRTAYTVDALYDPNNPNDEPDPNNLKNLRSRKYVLLSAIDALPTVGLQQDVFDNATPTIPGTPTSIPTAVGVTTPTATPVR